LVKTHLFIYLFIYFCILYYVWFFFVFFLFLFFVGGNKPNYYFSHCGIA